MEGPLALFGRKKKQQQGALASLPAARVTLAENGLRSQGRGGVCFKPPQEFVRAENEVQAVLDVVGLRSAARVRRQGDDLGYEWLVVEAGDLDELVETVELVGSELRRRALPPLAALFRFEGERPAYLVYGYSGGSFWPFVPTDEERGRDNDRELELKSLLERELPIERDLSRWLALFDAPV